MMVQTFTANNMKTIQILLVAFFATIQIHAQGIMLAGGAVEQEAELGLLDDYPGASAAYSLRSLSSTYTGPVVEVRRSSDNATQDFTADEVSTIAGWVGAGNDGFVRTWYDQSGNGNDAVQTTNARQPQIVDNGVLNEVNGKPAILFNDVLNNFLTISPVVSISTSNTSFNVIERYVPKSGNSGFNFRFSYDRTFNGSVNNNLTIASQSTQTFLGNIVYLEQRLESINFSSSGFYYLNGQNQGALSLTPNTALPGFADYIGNTTGDGVYAFNGNMQELIYYPSNQSTNRTGIESNINTYYNIY